MQKITEQGKAAEDTAKLINIFVNNICALLGEESKKGQIRQAVADAINRCIDPRKQDLERKTRLENHMHVLLECYHMISEGDNWERLQDISSALVAGGMAIQRMISEDYPEQEGKTDAG